MENVSFEKAKLEDLTFSDDCDLSSVKINKFDVYYKFDDWEKRLLLLKSESSNWGNKEKKEAEVFANTYLVHAKNQHWYILNSENLQRDYGNDIALKIIQQLNNFPKE